LSFAPRAIDPYLLLTASEDAPVLPATIIKIPDCAYVHTPPAVYRRVPRISGKRMSNIKRHFEIHHSLFDMLLFGKGELILSAY